MKKLALLLTLSAILCSGCLSSKPAEPEFVVTFDEPELTIYQIAAILTGCPERILRGIAFAESTYNPDAIGDDGDSIGLCQINERYHAERAALYGEYNPFDPLDSLIIAAWIYADNLRALGDERLAICAHRQGVAGVLNNGPTDWYYQRVIKNGSKTKGAT